MADTGVASFLLAVAGAVAGSAGSLFAAGRYFGRQARELEAQNRDITALEGRVEHLEGDRRSYARSNELTELKKDIATRRQELDERMNAMATTRDLAAVREIVQVESNAIRREIEQSRVERHGDRRVIDEMNRNLLEFLRNERGR